MIRWAGIVVIAAACVGFHPGCAGSRSDALAARMLPEEGRLAFLSKRGVDASPESRAAFLAGRIVPGMPREWILQLYGRPDRSSDLAWEYLDGRGRLLGRIVFSGDVVDSARTD